MSDWIRTKAGLEMAETIIRYLPRITVCLEELAKGKTTIELDSCDLSTEYKEELKKEITHDLKNDVLKLCDEMDIRQQENINLKFKVDELKHKLEDSIKYDQTSFVPTDDGSWKGR